jgi:hypothetical protein
MISCGIFPDFIVNLPQVIRSSYLPDYNESRSNGGIGFSLARVQTGAEGTGPRARSYQRGSLSHNCVCAGMCVCVCLFLFPLLQ